MPGVSRPDANRRECSSNRVEGHVTPNHRKHLSSMATAAAAIQAQSGDLGANLSQAHRTDAVSKMIPILVAQVWMIYCSKLFANGTSTWLE